MTPEELEKDEYYRSLRRNIRIIVVIVSFIPLIVVSAGILFQFHTSYREKVRAHLETLVKKHKQNIDHFLRERQHNIALLAATYEFEQLSDNDFLAVQLRKLQDAYGPVFSDIGVVSGDGAQISYAGPFLLAKARYADAEWFQKAIATASYTSDVFLGLRGFPHFIVTQRSFLDGKPWILRATVDFMAFNDLVESIHIGETGFAYIINRAGALQTRTSGRDIPENSPYLSLFEQGETGRDQILGGSRYSEKEGELIYVAGLLKGDQWALIYQQSVRDAYRSLTQARNAAIVVFLLGGIGIVTMAFVVSQRMVERISEADREKEIMNQQVIESGHLASLGELAAGIAHEINNPVAIMVEEAGWIEDLLEEEEFHESENLTEFRRALGQIRKQGIRARDITHKLLSFARRSDSRVEMVDVNDLVQEVVGLSAQQARYSNVSFETKLAPDLPPARVAQTELQQVLFNLVNNAIDAMGKDGGTIGVRSWSENGAIHLDVADTGPGIPQVNLNRIFEPFFTTKPVGKGTGLGLSICYGIVKKMGGDILVESTVGKGTRFEIRIPAEADAASGGSQSLSHTSMNDKGDER
jgi:two-component system NtrC family sensor kinase